MLINQAQACSPYLLILAERAKNQTGLAQIQTLTGFGTQAPKPMPGHPAALVT